MIGKYKKIISRYFSKSRIVSTVCLILIFFFSVNLTKEIVNRHQIDRKIRQYEEQTAKLEKENKEISVLIDAWQNGRQLEKEARLKLGLKKPGENVVLISRNNGQAGEEKIINPEAEVLGGIILPENTKNIPNYKKWWIFFFKR
ncbi:MAG: hypothetical protein A3B89_03485 [Candidatus Buchananbacteria bacterium RIFCSPHIGHO2_02_FULL_40_13]|uniref:Cell division protein FtsL n=1 Tax=Candidatus Buchananbacteria bacterium RIFCSPLOWO2_01_FULL_39_33 TaxID=1797543 RepID=A0A1G1YJX1_9BACT|nr:MAG: hypothetical protein A3B89_03485 [Candidatus Buchananbacteria bacterium RIFCSPHIGHO2_02_FULL_40_13]OGY51767.1 MAG: hypothetical protein A3A02_04010 [Candidatus Buchananbacteria bacterium RIFCSPLOWO2_01_FULL_39_33]